MTENKDSFIKLISIQPVSNTVAYVYDRFKDEAVSYWFPNHVAIYLVKQSAQANKTYEYVYLDNRPACSTEIITGYCKEDPSQPLVRTTAQSPGREVRALSVIKSDDFRLLLNLKQILHNGADYIPELDIKRECAKTITEDIDSLKEDLSLHGIIMSKDIEIVCNDAIADANDFLKWYNSEQ